MKRRNPFMLGTILVVMIGGLVVAQSQLAGSVRTPTDSHGGEGHEEGASNPNPDEMPASLPAPTGAGVKDTPTNEQLAQTVKNGAGGGGPTTTEPPMIPANEKMNDGEPSSTYPNSQWYQGSDKK